jgi:hypothetical protein
MGKKDRARNRETTVTTAAEEKVSSPAAPAASAPPEASMPVSVVAEPATTNDNKGIAADTSTDKKRKLHGSVLMLSWNHTSNSAP